MELAPTLCFTLFLENNPLQHLIKKKKSTEKLANFNIISATFYKIQHAK